MRLDRGAFRLDDSDITMGEVLAGSLGGNELAPLMQEIAARQAAADAARDGGLEPDDEEIQAAFDAWRQDRDLIAGEELERWLQHHEVALEDVAGWLEANLLADMLGAADVEPAEPAEPPVFSDILERVADEALFSGQLHGLVERFALRACAPEPALGDDKRMDEARRWMLAEAGFASEDEFMEAAALFGVEPPRARWALDRELAYRMHQQDVLTQEALRRGLAELRDDLRKYEVAEAIFRDEDVAREVACCVREDRDSFSRAAARAGESSRKSTWFHVDLERAPFGERLASTRVRDIVGPFALPDGRAELGQLRSMTEPDLSDPDVLTRVERRLVEQSLRRQVQLRVHFPPSRVGGA